ncbi:hypothetical protein M8C21_003038 [Ambrosia artemisiifolia]|uniref:Uncharacterized protein n=1 Tax=Ambrosia artemisiifolia TaxID=4212 RepID=A0AAD5CYS2_AMBAR|nr:hypothetical protein M8C21_003038 [Ambrosia artemisiifolia]
MCLTMKCLTEKKNKRGLRRAMKESRLMFMAAMETSQGAAGCHDCIYFLQSAISRIPASLRCLQLDCARKRFLDWLLINQSMLCIHVLAWSMSADCDAIATMQPVDMLYGIDEWQWSLTFERE